MTFISRLLAAADPSSRRSLTAGRTQGRRIARLAFASALAWGIASGGASAGSFEAELSYEARGWYGGPLSFHGKPEGCAAIRWDGELQMFYRSSKEFGYSVYHSDLPAWLDDEQLAETTIEVDGRQLSPLAATMVDTGQLGFTWAAGDPAAGSLARGARAVISIPETKPLQVRLRGTGAAIDFISKCGADGRGAMSLEKTAWSAGVAWLALGYDNSYFLHELARRLANGYDVFEPEPEFARELYSQAWEKHENAGSAVALAEMMARGQGGEPDGPQALELIAASLEKNEEQTYAHYVRGLVYEKGAGMPPNASRAIAAYRKATDLGLAWVKRDLGYLLAESGDAKERAEGLRLLQEHIAATPLEAVAVIGTLRRNKKLSEADFEPVLAASLEANDQVYNELAMLELREAIKERPYEIGAAIEIWRKSYALGRERDSTAVWAIAGQHLLAAAADERAEIDADEALAIAEALTKLSQEEPWNATQLGAFAAYNAAAILINDNREAEAAYLLEPYWSYRVYTRNSDGSISYVWALMDQYYAEIYDSDLEKNWKHSPYLLARHEGIGNAPKVVAPRAIYDRDGRTEPYVRALRCGRVMATSIACGVLPDQQVVDDYRLLILTAHGGEVGLTRKQAARFSSMFDREVKASLASGPACDRDPKWTSAIDERLKQCMRIPDLARLQANADQAAN